MADIELVIKIDEKLCCDGFDRPFTEDEKNILIKAVGNGTLLPKGHGKLIDADTLWDAYHANDYDFYEALDGTQAIIDAGGRKMTLDEAIKHAEEVANTNERLCETIQPAMQLSDYGKCAEEHRQLAKWLRDYKCLLEQPRWIPVKFRPLTDEEQKEYPDYCYMADCPMPNDGEEILVCTTYGTVEKDECGFDDGFYLDSGYDWQTDVIAWMPLPEPYKAESEEV